jgi:hypothetical protein
MDAQSGSVPVSTGSLSSVEWHQTTQFSDGSPGDIVGMESSLGASTIGGDAEQLSLADFFRRPVLISTISWTYDSVAFGQTINPWDLFFNSPTVQNRINNYYRLRATLKVKILITGNGFYSGRMLVSYLPLFQSDQITRHRAIIPQDRIEATKRMHCFLDPTTSTGAELHLPFFWPQEAIDITNQEYISMGTLDFWDLNGLRHANGSTDPVTISVFAWSDDVELSIPTSTDIISLVPQAGTEPVKKKKNKDAITKKPPPAKDEYATGVISRPASIVAHIAGKLTSVPMIAPYARATQVAASATSSIATLFGYSKPIELSPRMYVKQSNASNQPNSDGHCLVTKLALDSKQETTIDTRVMGLAGHDEMMLKEVTNRFTWLTACPWKASFISGSNLFSTQVHPGMYDKLLVEPLEEFHLTSVAEINELFSQWRGTMRFRIQVVASAYHRGRLRVSWDPKPSTTAITQLNTQYNFIVDIAEERDFVVEVGWGAKLGMLRCYPIASWPVPFETISDLGVPASNVPPGYDSIHSNGALTISIFDTLTLPQANTDPVFVNVFVAGGEDLEFAAPATRELNTFTIFEPQSGLESPDMAHSTTDSAPLETPCVASFATPPGDVESALLTYSGEAVSSLRTLLKRTCWHSFLWDTSPGTIAGTVAGRRAWTFPTYPTHHGKDPLSPTISTMGPYSYSNFIPLQWAMLMYTGYRGGIRVHAMRTFPDSGQCHYLSRTDDFEAGYALEEVQLPSNTNSNLQALWMTSSDTSPRGMELVNSGQQSVIEVEIPFYNKRRFLYTKRRDQYDTNPNNEYKYAEYGIVGRRSNLSSGALIGFSVGEDFQLGFYTGLPVLFLREVPPP